MKLLSSLLCSLPVLLFSQVTPCEGGFAGEYPCDGYDLVAHLDLNDMGGASNGNDCWGWTDPLTGIEYAIMGLNNATAFVELCDPANPVFLGRLETHSTPSLWRDMKVYDNHAFIVSEAGQHGMQVFDLTQLRNVENPPVTFQETAHFNEFGNCHNIAINEETGYAYPVGTGFFSGGPIFVNIQEPANPVGEGGYSEDGYTHDAQTVVYIGPDTEHAGKEICFASNADTFTIIDVDDKTDPFEISRTGYDDVGYTHQGWLSEDHRFYFMNDEGDETSGSASNTRTIVWDVQDLDNPFVLEYHGGVSQSIDHNLYVHNGKLYQANYTSGLRVLQFDENADPLLNEIGFFDVFPAGDPVSFSGAWSCYPYFESGLVLISSMDRGLLVVKPTEVEVSECVVSGVDELDQEAPVTIFPNPAKNELNLTWPQPFTGQLRILDVQGRCLYSEFLQNSLQFGIDVSDYPSGIYIADMAGKSVNFNMKFNKE
jgi:choice-of-anchor B domain-containing protein